MTSSQKKKNERLGGACAKGNEEGERGALNPLKQEKGANKNLDFMGRQEGTKRKGRISQNRKLFSGARGHEEAGGRK